MNYCSIEEAWGTHNNASNQFKEHMTNTGDYNRKANIEYTTESEYKPEYKPEHKPEHKPEYKPSPIVIEEKVYNTDNRIDELNNCDSFILHVRNCKKCYNKIQNQHKSNQIERIIDENRDTIVLILIGIAILLFFNLINNITKN